MYSAARPSRRNDLIIIWRDTEYLACAEHLCRAGLSAETFVFAVLLVRYKFSKILFKRFLPARRYANTDNNRRRQRLHFKLYRTV